MSKRFGRNQRRRAREEIAALEVSLDYARKRSHSLASRLVDEQSRHEAEVRQARRARDTVRISVNCIFDETERPAQIIGTFETVSRERLYSACPVDTRHLLMESDAERAAFIKYAGEAVAEQALPLILRHWRTR